MGIRGLYPALEPCKSLESLHGTILAEAISRQEHGERPVTIGIDANPWLYEIQSCVAQARTRGASWALTSGDSERNVIIDRLGFWVEITANIGFFFDGQDVPRVKRKTAVRSRPHALIRDFKALIEAFGFAVYDAPGEAEAELSHLNKIGVLDFIVSPDSDVFLFGATRVLRSPRNAENRDLIELYTRESLLQHDPDRLSQAGILFIAVMAGGEYCTAGLPGCGFETAYALAKTQLPAALWNIAHCCAGVEQDMKAKEWRDALRSELGNNTSGHLSGRRPSMARNVPDDFPDLAMLRDYTHPSTSGSSSALGLPDLMFWSSPDLSLPDTPTLTQLFCWIFGDWDWGQVFGKLVKCAWPGHLSQQLIDIKKARALRCMVGLGFEAVGEITKLDKNLKHRPTSLYPYYRIKLWTFSVATQALKYYQIERNSGLTPGDVTISETARISILAPIIQHALPALMKEYHQNSSSDAELVSATEFWYGLKNKIHHGANLGLQIPSSSGSSTQVSIQDENPCAPASQYAEGTVIDFTVGSEPVMYRVTHEGSKEILDVDVI